MKQTIISGIRVQLFCQVDVPELVCPFPQCSDKWIWDLRGGIKKKKKIQKETLS